MRYYSDAHICQCLSRLATARRNSLVTIAGDRRKTGEQFVDGVVGLAGGLLEQGLRTGDVVAICALNSDLFLAWLLAVTFVGGIAAPLNYRWSFEEARLAMEVVRPVMLVTDDCRSYWYSKLNIDAIPALRWHVFMNSPSHFKNESSVLTTEKLENPGLRSLSFNYAWAPNAAAIICFTSGTTGRPKGVTISHSALIVQSLAKVAVVGYNEEDVYLHTVPLCHIGGISSALTMLMVGGCHVLIPKFEANLALQTIEELQVTSFTTVPAIMADIISLIRLKEMWKAKENVRKILNGGGVLSIELIEDATKLFPRAKLLSAYGMTETCSSLTFMTLYDPTSDNLSHSFRTTGNVKSSLVHRPVGVCVGEPPPHVELRISLEYSSHVGRILTRGPQVMLGYWGQIQPEEALTTRDEGWLDTGDIGQIDEHGNLWLVGRTNGRIKSGGENVYPEEVEVILSQHPGISGVVVVGLPDARLTEKVVACVKVRDDWRWVDSCSNHSAGTKDQILSSDILQQFCRKNSLSSFKVPKGFVIWKEEFPLTTTGKLRRDEVRGQVMYCMKFLRTNL